VDPDFVRDFFMLCTPERPVVLMAGLLTRKYGVCVCLHFLLDVFSNGNGPLRQIFSSTRIRLGGGGGGHQFPY